MTKFRLMTLVLVSLLVGGCAGTQPSQHRSIEQEAAEYQTIPVEDWVPSKQCTDAFNSSGKSIVVSASNLRYRLPNGVNAAAFCFRVPEGASSLELNTYKRSTWKNNSGRILFPSLLYLDGEFNLISDDPRPARSYPVRFMKPEGARIETDLVEQCKYVVVYLNPAEMSVTANTARLEGGAYAYMPRILPSSPYGEFRIDFGR